MGAFGRVGHVEIAHLDVVELAAELANRHVALVADPVDDATHVLADALDPCVTLEQRRPFARTEVLDFAYLHIDPLCGCAKRDSDSGGGTSPVVDHSYGR